MTKARRKRAEVEERHLVEGGFLGEALLDGFPQAAETSKLSLCRSRIVQVEQLKVDLAVAEVEELVIEKMMAECNIAGQQRALMDHCDVQQEAIASLTHTGMRFVGVCGELGKLFEEMLEVVPENLRAQFNDQFEAAIASGISQRHCTVAVPTPVEEGPIATWSGPSGP